MNTDRDLITIGITCFNAVETISRAIESAISQTWSNTEILVTDDCSVDGSLDILRKYESTHENIRVFKNVKNEGVSFNRQKLLDKATGKYLAFFDDDDWSFPDRLEKQIIRLQNYAREIGHENIYCYGDRILIKSGEAETILAGIGREQQVPYGLIVADMILGDKRAEGFSWGLLGTGTMLAPVKTLRELGGFDPSFRRSAEIDLALRSVSQRDVHFISVPEPIIKQYYTPTEDKSIWRVGRYHMQLVLKHRKLVMRRKLALKIFYPYTRYFKKKLTGKVS